MAAEARDMGTQVEVGGSAKPGPSLSTQPANTLQLQSEPATRPAVPFEGEQMGAAIGAGQEAAFIDQV